MVIILMSFWQGVGGMAFLFFTKNAVLVTITVLNTKETIFKCLAYF